MTSKISVARARLARSTAFRLWLALCFTLLALGAVAPGAAAQDVPEPTPSIPERSFSPPRLPEADQLEDGPLNDPERGVGDGILDNDITIDIGQGEDNPSQSVLLIVGLSLLSLAPSIVIMLTSFTRIAVVLSLTRNALGLQGVPPNQVIVGLSLFLSLFIMAPTLSEMNEVALQPYLDGQISQTEAYERATGPMREFMLDNTRSGELDLMMNATPGGRPETIDDVGMTTIIPAFVLSELKTAFLMGFVIFIPFLIIDLVVASVLMSLGMMMLPPVFVSLPFKLLLFVLVGGWSLVVETLLVSYS